VVYNLVLIDGRANEECVHTYCICICVYVRMGVYVLCVCVHV